MYTGIYQFVKLLYYTTILQPVSNFYVKSEELEVELQAGVPSYVFQAVKQTFQIIGELKYKKKLRSNQICF